MASNEASECQDMLAQYKNDVEVAKARIITKAEYVKWLSQKETLEEIQALGVDLAANIEEAKRLEGEARARYMLCRREEGIKELHQQPANNGGRSMPLWSGHVKELSSAALTECAQSSAIQERYNSDTINMIEFGDGEDCLEKIEEDMFMYAFVALYPSIKGWQYCKPVVAVDGTFLKSTYRGTLLIASAQDPTGSILPLAYAIVDSENNASWEWFFVRFKDAFGERKRMCIVSDMHEGIKNTAATLYPQVPHCVCIWHLWNNINTNYKKNHLQLKDIFFAMTKAYTIEKFDYHMAEVDRIDKRVKDSLINVGYERWSRAHFTVNRTLTMTSNIAESINAMLKTARELPVLPLLEYIRQLIGRWNVTNQKNAIESFIDLGKKYDTMLMDNLELSHRMKVTPSTRYLYSVLDKGKQRMVFLKDRTCSCRRFQLDELPYAHAWTILKYKYVDHMKYCSVYYTRK
ncbi:uncharacterized protein [Nicotiana tomentosiformis]|uniref:uncharacterized protein n=1 Tax=Nicotiana tomentosiformis TaxID=4098 RepID=UPI00388C8247